MQIELTYGIAISKHHNPMERHREAVAVIAASVRHHYDRREPFRIFHGSTNSTRSSLYPRQRIVNTGALSHVLKVDTKTRIALVEPNVPMDRLVETTMKYGLVPPVVMEFPGITVGGGYAGTSGESSSFKHGFFDRTIKSVEMVLANGEVVTASPNEKADLFHGAAGALGTLGITTLVELQLLEVKSYVETTYHPVASVAEAIRKLQEVTADQTYDYIDGILFSKKRGAIITGRLTNVLPESAEVSHFSRTADPWFCLRVQEKITQNVGPVTEAIPLDEYLFRYDRGGFWVGLSVFYYFMIPFNRWTRWFLDDFLHTRMLYKALLASGHSKQYMVQDLALPYATVPKFIDFTDETLGIYPLWLCPLRQETLPTLHPHSRETEADGNTLKPMLNIGLWGPGSHDEDEFVEQNRKLESKLKELGGMKWLYAQTYYTEEEFWSIYDRKWYDALRAKYNATSLPSVYDKVKVDVRAEKKAVQDSWRLWLLTFWPLSGLRGIYKAIGSGEYLLAKKSTWQSIEAKE